MAKTQILDYYIYLTDQTQVETYNAQLAAGTGPGALIFNPATGQLGVYRAPYDPAGPGGAAIEFSAPLQEESTPLSAPCIRSPWFTNSNTFPRNVATFQRSTGWWIFGSNTRFYWSAKFVYAPPITDDVGPLPRSVIPNRRFIFGPGLPVNGEGVVVSGSDIKFSREFNRRKDGYGIRFIKDSTGTESVQYTLPNPTNQSWERFYVRMNRLPGATQTIWFGQNPCASGEGMKIQVATDGSMIFNNRSGTAGTVLGTGGQLVVGVWAKIDVVLEYPDNAASSARVWLNGVLISSTLSWTPAGLPGGRHSLSGLGDIAIGTTTAMSFDFCDWRNSEWASYHSAPGSFAPPLDWEFGSHMVTLKPNALGPAHANWTGGFQGLGNAPNDLGSTGAGQVSLTTTTAGAIAEVDVNAVQNLGAYAAMRWVALEVGLVSMKNNADGQGTLGYGVGGAPPSMTALTTQTSAYTWQRVLLPGPAAILPFEIDDIILRHVKGTGANASNVKALQVVLELIGIFNEEDLVPPATTVDTPVPPGPYRGIHNSAYPSTPWAYGTNPPLSPVIVKSGLYTGTGVGQDLLFPAPVHWMWVRPVTGTNAGWKWWASTFGSKQGIDQPAGNFVTVGDVLQDFSFVPASEDADQQMQFIVRIGGSATGGNALGTVYQYVAFMDPGARYSLAGATAVTDANVPHTAELPDPTFTPEFGFFFKDLLGSATTSVMALKGPGHATSAYSPCNTGTPVASAVTFLEGELLIELGYITATSYQQFPWFLFRRADGNNAATEARVMAMGTYVGTGVNPRNIAITPASGQRPLWAIVQPHNAVAIIRDPSHTGTTSQSVTGTAIATTGITGGGIDFFTVNSALNALGITYTWFVLFADTAAGNGGFGVDGTYVPVPSDSPFVDGEGEPTIISGIVVGGDPGWGGGGLGLGICGDTHGTFAPWLR